MEEWGDGNSGNFRRGRENSRRTGRNGEEIIVRADVLVGREMVRGRKGNHEGGGGFRDGECRRGKVEVRRWMRGEMKRPGEKSPGGEVLMARREGIRDDGGWLVRSRGEDGERGGSDVRKQERIREWWGQESEMVSAEEIWRFPGEGLLGKTGSSWRGCAVLTREVGQQRDSGKRMI